MLKDLLKQDIPVRDVCKIKYKYGLFITSPAFTSPFQYFPGRRYHHPSELEAVEKMAGYLGIASSDFLSIRNMFVPETDSSYKILEIEPTATDEEVKKLTGEWQ
jgi:DnaJ like chaperone protein